jgi:acyl carrier protein
MERNDVLKKVNDVFKDILDNDNIILRDETTANDIEEWDSLAHVQLVVAIERSFKIRFTSREIQSWENIAEMLDCICDKIK